jgi:glycosyltransferase involved in cell wall biosynthesis
MSQSHAPRTPEDPSRVSPLRVLHVVPYFPPSQAGGGIREAVATLARAQSRAGCRVTVWTTDVGTPRSRRAPEPIPGIEVRAFRNLSNRLAWDDVTLPLGLRAAARRGARDFEAVHLHGHRHLGALLVARARRPRPFVLSPHGTAPRIERRQGWKRLADPLLFDGILDRAAICLALSDVEEAQLGSLGVPAHRIRRLSNPLDPQSILPLPGRGAFRKKHGVPEGAPMVLYLGRLTPNKRVDVLLRAVAGLRGAVLAVAGPDGGALEALRREAGTAGSARVIFAGPLDARQRREALADADVLALVSEQEIFGLAPMEALLAGVIPVVSAGTGCAERIRAWDAGFVVEGGDPGAVREAIRAALADPEESRRRAARGGEQVIRALSPEAVAARTMEIYEEVAG